MKPIERVTAELWPGVSVVPVMDPWASDSVSLRRAGIATFGTSGTFADDSCNPHGAKHVCLELTTQDVLCPTLQL